MSVIGKVRDWVDTLRGPRNAVETYEQIISDRQKRYADLRENALKVLYLKTKLEAGLVERRADIARVVHEARSAARRGDDESAVTLLARKRILVDRLKEAEDDVAEARREAAIAKETLERFKHDIRALEWEKMRAATASHSQTLRYQFSQITGEPSGKEQLALAHARREVDEMLEHSEVQREIVRQDLLQSGAIEDPDTELRIELARLKQSTRRLAAANGHD